MNISAFKELTSQACPFMGQVETGLWIWRGECGQIPCLFLTEGTKQQTWNIKYSEVSFDMDLEWEFLAFNGGDQMTNMGHKICDVGLCCLNNNGALQSWLCLQMTR